jgi:tetratricopeptide (TPR) repeat protein
MPKKVISDRNFKKGERLFSQKDFKNAAECFQKAAEDGHADAQYMLGVMYAKGMGVEQDYKEAAKKFLKAAELGHLNAQCMLGSLYYDGKGVEEDEKKAVEWYRKASDVVAQSSLIKLYLQGSLGLPKDYEKALTWLRLAAEGGDDDGQYYLANLWKLLENAKKKGFDIQFEEQILKAESISHGTPPDDLLFGLHLDALKEKSEGNFDKAIGIWKNILEKDSQYLYAINAIARAYAETGELHKSKKYIDMAMKVGGEQADSVRIELARILKETENFEDAEKILNAFEHKGLKGLEVIAILTHVLTSQDKMKRALELIEKFLVKEGVLKPLSDDGEYSLRSIIYGGAFCMLRCKPTRVIDFLEKYGHILSPEQLHTVYLYAGINYLEEEHDGVRALKCLSEAVRNEPDDSEAKEALSDAALKVIADFGGQGKISENKKAALATAYEVIDNRKKDLENKKSRGK